MRLLKQVKAEILYKAEVFRMKQDFWQSLKFKKSLDTSKVCLKKVVVYNHDMLDIL